MLENALTTSHCPRSNRSPSGQPSAGLEWSGTLMEGNNKHSPMRDEAMQGDVEGMIRSGRSTRAEDFKDPEPPADGEPDIDRAPGDNMVGGTPAGMSGAEVTARSEIAETLRRTAFPNDRDGLLAAARDANASDSVLADLRSLPTGQEYTSVGQVWRALGHSAEDDRF